MKFDLTTADKATPAQLDFLLKLIAIVRDRGERPPVQEDEVEELTKQGASEFIDEMKVFLDWD